MTAINYNDAATLESLVRRLFKCVQGGVSGLVCADNFQSRPFDAAVMVISYIYAAGLESSEMHFSEFLQKYRRMFTFSSDCDIETGVKNYIRDLKNIIDEYVED